MEACNQTKPTLTNPNSNPAYLSTTAVRAVQFPHLLFKCVLYLAESHIETTQKGERSPAPTPVYLYAFCIVCMGPALWLQPVFFVPACNANQPWERRGQVHLTPSAKANIPGAGAGSRGDATAQQGMQVLLCLLQRQRGKRCYYGGWL